MRGYPSAHKMCSFQLTLTDVQREACKLAPAGVHSVCAEATCQRTDLLEQSWVACASGPGGRKRRCGPLWRVAGEWVMRTKDC